MSTILTALKKSQQQRDRGAVPTLSFAVQPAPTPTRRRWFWLMVGGVALNGAAFALLVWWLGGYLGFGDSIAGEVAHVATPAPAAEAVRPAESLGQAEPQPVAGSGRRQASAASLPTTGAGPKPAADRLAAAEPQERQPAPAPKAAYDLARAVPDPAPARPARLPAPEPAPLPAAEEVAAEAAAAVSARPPEPDPGPYASLPKLHNLSYTLQTVLPDLSILVHVYGEEPRNRFVIIQNKKYREGDVLAEDLALEAITPSGAVVRYKDTPFQITP